MLADILKEAQNSTGGIWLITNLKKCIACEGISKDIIGCGIGPSIKEALYFGDIITYHGYADCLDKVTLENNYNIVICPISNNMDLILQDISEDYLGVNPKGIIGTVVCMNEQQVNTQMVYDMACIISKELK